MKKVIRFLSVLFCFSFLSLSAQDALLNAASRKVIIEAPTEPGTHLDVFYKTSGWIPTPVTSGDMIEVGITLIIDAYSDVPDKLPLVAVRVNGEEIEPVGSQYSYTVPEGEGDIVISAEFGLLYKVDFTDSLNGHIELYAADSEEPLTTGSRVTANTEIKVKVIPDSGCDLFSLVVNDEDVASQVEDSEYRFVLKKNTSVSAVFKKVYHLTVLPFEHGSMRVVIYDNGDNLNDIQSGSKILDGQTMIVWLPTVDETYEVGSVLLNGVDITDKFSSGTYGHTVKGDVEISVTTRKKTYGLTVKDFVGGTIKVEFEDEGVISDVSTGGRVIAGSMLKIYEPVLDEGYELVYVSLNESDIKDQFKDGIYSLTMEEDVMLIVKAKEIDKVFKLTVDEIEGGSIDVQMYVGGDLADVPADGNIKNGTMLMISEPVLDEGYELVSVMLNGEDITGLFDEGVYFYTLRKDVTISVKTKYVSGVEDEQADRVRIYPNPFMESCVVSGVAAGTSVRVFNMTGACVFSKVAGTGETEIRLSGLASGVYILKLEKDGDSSCHKLIRK